MSFFLTEEMEEELSSFLQRENEQICKAQLKSPSILPEHKEMIEKTIESGSPVPYFDTRFGYYSISFTPCEYGNRIYVHHHITDNSEVIFDPSANVTDAFDAKKTLENIIEDREEYSDNIIEEKQLESPFEKLQNPTQEYNIEMENMVQGMMSGQNFVPPSV